MDNKKSFYDIFSESNSSDSDEKEFSFSDIFHQMDDNAKSVENEEKSFKDVLSSSIVEEEVNNDDVEYNNLFFDDVDSKDEVDQIIQESNNSLFFDHSNESTSTLEKDNNPFFEEDNHHDEVEDHNLDEKNMFFDHSNESTSTLEKDNNPFFEEDNHHEEVENHNVDEKNMFFDYGNESTSTLEKDNNPFFEEDNHQHTEEKKDNNSSLLEKEIVGSNKKENVEKLNSPFFEENNQDKNQEVNPLLLNSLNLIENENNSKNVNVKDLDQVNHFNVKIVKKKEPLFKMILGIISYAIFIWLLLVGIVLLIYVLDIKIRAAKGDYSKPTYNAYVVLTGSMLPGIQVGDVVVTKKTDAAVLQEKDIITFASADTRFLNTIITHRIIKKNFDPESKKYTFQTKGDNNNVADSALVPESNIYGKVILKIPKLGYLQEFLASDGGWIIVILIPCLAVISYDIVKLIKGLKRKKYKNIKVQK